MIEVPPHFFSVRYNGDRYPGAPETNDISNGANCQLFACELLRYFGKCIADLRSSNLWEDRQCSYAVTDLKAFDLLLYNSKPQAWGAHVAVFLGEGKIIHLSKEIGRPVIWAHEQFLETPRYRYFIGAKRVLDEAVVGV